MAWTTPEAVLNRWLGSGAPEASDPKLLVFIEDAEDEILRHYPEIDARIADLSLPLNRVQKVVARVVIRAYKVAYNPLSSFNRTAGPFSEGGTYDTGTKKHISLTSEDIDELAPPASSFSYGTTDMAPNAGLPISGIWTTVKRYPIGWNGGE